MQTARDYLLRSLKWLGGVFVATVGILAGADQLIRFGWPIEWYVIAFLSVGFFMLVILLVYFYKQMRRFEAKVQDVATDTTKRSPEKLLAREFRLKDTLQYEVARLPLEKGQEIKVNMRASDQTHLTIMTSAFPRKKLEVHKVAGTFTQVFSIPEKGNWIILLKDDRGIGWEGLLGPKKKSAPITGHIQVFKVLVTRALPHVETF